METEQGDAFWDAYDEEDRSVQRGTEAGIKHGRELGWVEGWELGVKQGYQLGLEIGFFAGSVEVLKRCQRSNPDIFNDKVMGLIERIETLVSDFPMENNTEIDLDEKLKKIQELHKQSVSVIGVGQHFVVKKQTLDY